MFLSRVAAKAELDAAVKTVGKNVTGVQGDVSNLGDLDRLYDTVKAAERPNQCPVRQRRVIGLLPLGSITGRHFDKIFKINVKGLLFTVQKALPLFQNGGAIILNAFDQWIQRVEGSSVYSATKAAVRSFVRSWTVRSEAPQDSCQCYQSRSDRYINDQ